MLSCARARPKRAPQADAHMQDLDAGSVCSLGAITCWSPAELQDARDVSCHRSSHQSGTPWPIWMPLWLTKSASGTRSKLRSSLDHSVDGRPAERRRKNRPECRARPECPKFLVGGCGARRNTALAHSPTRALGTLPVRGGVARRVVLSKPHVKRSTRSRERCSFSSRRARQRSGCVRRM